MQKMLAAVFALMLAIPSAGAPLAAEVRACGAGTPASEALQAATVTRVIDGDTVVLESGERVRLLGIDAPERGEPGAVAATVQLRGLLREAERQVHDRPPEESQGRLQPQAGGRLLAVRPQVKAAGASAEGLRARLWLRFDRRRRDRYRRLLAYLIRADGACLNAALVRRGAVRVLRRYPFREKEAYLRLESEARAQGVGLWRR